MREILSNCERNFVNKAIETYTRLDGRSLLETRPVRIYFGSNWGCCMVTLGQTRAIAQITCDIQPPKLSRPNEGILHINVELNPLVAQCLEGGKQSETGVIISRQLEKCFKDSKCIDLESLCIVADKKVWNLRVDINIINNDGNLVDCASIATLAALLHFHRPDVTSTGEDIIIHSFTEKDPLPLTLFHYPVCVSFITFEGGNTVMDPTYMEERVGVAQLTLGTNSYRELCSLHFNYLTQTLTIADIISAVSNHAANYAAKLIQQIKEAVARDVEVRYKKGNRNTQHFKECITMTKPAALNTDSISIKLQNWDKIHNLEQEGAAADTDMQAETYEDEEAVKYRIVKPGEGSAELVMDNSVTVGEGGQNTWISSESSEEEDKNNDVEVFNEIKPKTIVIDSIDLDGDSEEEVTEILETKDIMQ